MTETPPMETVSQAMARLAEAGFTGEYSARDRELFCSRCGTATDPSTIAIEAVVRFEGNSDPDDEAILFALRGQCGDGGLYVAPYGPAATADDVAVMVSLQRRERG